MRTWISGIYTIRHIISGKLYIGSSANIPSRWNTHLWFLNTNSHSNKHLQRSWTKYGSNEFEFKILLYCAVNDLVYFEQRAIDILNTTDQRRGYNIRLFAANNQGIIGDVSWNRTRLLNPEQVREIRLSFDTIVVLAEKYKVSGGTIANILYGRTYKWVSGEIRKRIYKKLTEEQVIEIRNSVDSQTILAERYGVSQAAINYARAGTTYSNISTKAVPKHTGFLPEDQIKEIKFGTESQKIIARRYHISQSLVSMIRSGQRYGWVE